MIELVFDTNLEEKLITLAAFEEIFGQAKRSALSSVGFFVINEVRDFVESGGAGKWPKPHPLTLKFRKKYGLGGAWRRSFLGKDSPFSFLGKFARYRVVTSDAALLKFGFGKGKARKSGNFDPFLEEIGRRMQRRNFVRVTPAMRKHFGASRRGKRDVPGIDFFPLRKRTSVLVTPPRPITQPVLDRIKDIVPALFGQKFQSSLLKKIEKL